jgi:hypothetical protein
METSLLPKERHRKLFIIMNKMQHPQAAESVKYFRISLHDFGAIGPIFAGRGTDMKDRRIGQNSRNPLFPHHI